MLCFTVWKTTENHKWYDLKVPATAILCVSDSVMATVHILGETSTENMLNNERYLESTKKEMM